MVVSAPDKTNNNDQSVSAEVETAPVQTPAKRRNWFALILIALVLQVVALLFTEVMLYVAGLGEEEIFAFDPEVGTRHMTNKRITWRSEGYGLTYFDADGLPEEGLTLEKPANTYRIAVLGDSMVEGLQVAPDTKFTRMLNREVKLANGENVQFINFGTSGYSTAQEYVQLKNQVLKYAPDMVVLCYHSRDIFENWSPADATLTNVRPVALHLPGQKLCVDSSSIKEWMKSPRAKFLRNIAWIRQNSRIWGLVSAMETELSFKNEAYKTMMALFTRPGKTLRKMWADCSKPENWKLPNILAWNSSGPSFNIQFFEGNDPNAQAGGNPYKIKKKKKKKPVSQPAMETAAVAPVPKKPLSAGEQNYIDLMTRTLGSLVTEMNTICNQNKSKLVVVALPARIYVAPFPGQDNTMYGLDYAGEVAVVKGACDKSGIPFCDLLQPALKLEKGQREGLFYALHLTPFGHRFIADNTRNFFEREAVRNPSVSSEPAAQ